MYRLEDYVGELKVSVKIEAKLIIEKRDRKTRELKERFEVVE